MKILLSDSFDPPLAGRLARFGEVTADKAELPECDVVLIRSKTKATAEYIAGAPKLKIIIRGGVGLDNVDAAAARERGIKVFNTPEASSVAVAELAFAFLLAIPSRIIDGHMSMKEGKWLKKELKRTELFQKTLGIIGIGRIGTEIALRAHAFGMKILATDLEVKHHTLADMTTLDDLCARSRLHLASTLPLNDATRGMVNARLIDKMKNGVILVNTGRGKMRRRGRPRRRARERQGRRLRHRRLGERPTAGDLAPAQGQERLHVPPHRGFVQGEPAADRRPDRRDPGAGARQVVTTKLRKE